MTLSPSKLVDTTLLACDALRAIGHNGVCCTSAAIEVDPKLQPLLDLITVGCVGGGGDISTDSMTDDAE